MRREVKYLIRERDSEALAQAVRPYVTPDNNASGEMPTYVVRSIYYDTPALRDYTDKASGDWARRKVRVRGYGLLDSGPVFLEVKRKRGDVSWKDRVALDRGEAARLLSEGRPGGSAPDEVFRFLYRLRAERRLPVLLIAYDRQPYVGRFDPSLRITFDCRLRCAAYPEVGSDLSGLYSDTLTPILDGQFVLEVKYDRLFPSWLVAPLAALGAQRQALSKYGMGLESEISRSPRRFGRPALSALT